jgi:LCP family protein required for cell wall assembly
MAAPLPPRSRPRRTWPQRLLLGAGIVGVVVCLLGAAAVGYGYWRLGQVSHYDVEVGDVANGAPQNFLIVGSDSRDAVDPGEGDAKAFLAGEVDGKRSDTIMVARIDPKSEAVVVLSIPRDLWVPIAGTAHSEKINSAYGLGRQTLIDTIRQNLDIPINHYVEIDFRGFKSLVRAIGGVPIYFDRPVKDTHTGLMVTDPGCVNLGDDQALAFARSRYLQYRTARGWSIPDPTADLGRISRQQLFIRTALHRALTAGNLTNPITLNRLIDTGVSNVGVDRSLSTREIAALARRFVHFDPAKMETLALPVSDYYPHGASALRLDTKAAQRILNRFRTLTPEQAVTSTVDVTVLNGSGINGQAADVAGALSRIDFQIADVSTNGRVVDRTEIHYGPGAEAGADLLARHLSAGAVLVPDARTPAAHIVLVTGRDFTTITEVAKPAAPTTTTTTTAPAPAGSSSTTAAPATTTTAPGFTPGQPPPGVTCG